MKTLNLFCKFLTTCLLALTILGATTANQFLPSWQQFCTKKHAEFHGTINLHDILTSWAKFNNKSIVITNIPNQKINLDLKPTPWGLLIKQLSLQFNFKINTKQAIWEINQKPAKLNWFYNHNLSKTTIFSMNKYLATICKKCKLSADNNIIWISAPPNWLQTIKQTLLTLDQEPKKISIKITLLQIDKAWLSNWGKTWQAKNNHPLPWLEAILNQTDKLTITNTWLSNQALLHLLTSVKTQKSGTLTAQANLATNNKQPAIIESGLIMPYQIKDSRNRTQVIFKPITLKFKLTPTIQKQSAKLNTIISYKKLNDDKDQSIQTHNITTTVNLKNHQTLVISSLNTDLNETLVEKNIFSSIPLIGQILQYQTKQHNNLTLIAFITIDF